MGYDIFVADDPALEQEYDELKGLYAREDNDSTDYPGFSVPNRVMRELDAEMKAQEMWTGMPRWKFEFNGGEHVTVDEISSALAVAGYEPETIYDEEGWELWRSWLDFLRIALEHDGVRVF
jgi:hypothetical protein